MTTKEETTRRREILDSLWGLTDVARILNEALGLPTEDDPAVETQTPRAWWYRTRDGREMESPMPDPGARVGVQGRPMFWGKDIIRWYCDWKDITKPRWVR